MSPTPAHRMMPDPDLPPRLRAWLERLPEAQLPVTYQQAADAMGLVPPRTIQRVALALEALMREDAAAGRPLIAALVVSRRGELPRPGFFELAVELGRLPADPAGHEIAYRQEFGRVLAARAE